MSVRGFSYKRSDFGREINFPDCKNCQAKQEAIGSTETPPMTNLNFPYFIRSGIIQKI